MLHGSGERAQCPQPRSGSGDADIVRASQLQHAVEHVDCHVHLSCPTLLRVRAQLIPDHALEPADRGLGPGSFRVPGGFLPSHAALLGDELEVAARWVGSLAAVRLGTAVARGGTMTAASGWRSLTLV